MKMDIIDDNQADVFSFNWSIQNFSYCLQKKGETLESPLFQIGSLSTNKWRLHLYPRGNALSDDIGYSIERFCKTNYKLEISFALSIPTVGGLFKDERLCFEQNKDSGFKAIFAQHELKKNRLDAYLKNDLFTIRCRIYNASVKMKSGQCFARTVINVERISYIWELQNFHLLQNEIKQTHQHPILSEIPSFSMDFFMTRGTSEDRIQIEVKQIDTNMDYFTTCEIFLLDADGKVTLSVRDEHWFKASKGEQIWILPYISKNQLLDCENLYSKDGALSLRCDFAVSTGVEYSKVERAEYGIVLSRHAGYCEKAPSTESNLPGSWKDNLQHFYEEGKFSDFIVRTANKEFKVHRTILCARSEVFSAMFERDMAEARTDVLEIVDIDDDIVSKLLLFIYTDTVGDLDWEIASRLYFAADKYGIVALKRKCCDFLKVNLSTSNVCVALCLSDMHQDEALKSSARDYIHEHHSEIINSEEWKAFMVGNVQLASETMHLFIKNLRV